MAWSIFIAPVDTQLPKDSASDGAPVTLDDEGVTRWEPLRGIL